MNTRALVFSLFALTCLTVAVVFNVRTHRFLSRSVQAEATVTSVSGQGSPAPGSGHGTSPMGYTYAIEFSAADGRPVRALIDSAKGNWFTQGQKVRVLFDPANPSRGSVMYSWRGMYYLQSAFFYAAALLFGGIAWSLREKK